MEELRDSGFAALLEGRWKQADEIFEAILKEDPQDGMACLGRALAAEQIRGREELAENWDRLRENPEFLGFLQPAKEDFLPWILQDMEKAREAAAVPDSGLDWPDFSRMGTGRKLLLGFAGVQVLLFLTVLFFFCRGQWKPEEPGISFAANLFLSAVVCGLPVILGPVYGNSIVEGGRFCTLLKYVNNIVAILGCGVSALFMAAFHSSFQETGAGEDWYAFLVFVGAFAAHLLSLVIPVILDKVEYGL